MLCTSTLVQITGLVASSSPACARKVDNVCRKMAQGSQSLLDSGLSAGPQSHLPRRSSALSSKTLSFLPPSCFWRVWSEGPMNKPLFPQAFPVSCLGSLVPTSMLISLESPRAAPDQPWTWVLVCFNLIFGSHQVALRGVRALYSWPLSGDHRGGSGQTPANLV